MMNFLPTTGILDIQCDSSRYIHIYDGNVAVGNLALKNNTTGNQNTATGYNALNLNTDGFGNSAFGYNSLYLLATGIYNTAVGQLSLELLTSGNRNTVVGDDTGRALTTGDYNSFFGHVAGEYISSGNGNTCCGSGTGKSGVAGALNYSINLGYGAKVTTDYYCQIGMDGEATHNSKMKFRSQVVCDEAWRDAIIGLAKIDGTGNFIKGTDNHIVRWNGTTGLQDSAITIADTTAIMNFLPTTGLLDIQCDSIRNIFMCSNSLNGSIRIGRDALSTVAYASDILENVGIGNSALKSNTTGTNNISIGTSSLYTNSIGIQNTAIGSNAGYSSIGDNNNYFGNMSGMLIASGSGNTCVGNSTGRTASGALNYSISLGYGAKVATDYYCQIGMDGEATHNSKMKFRSQVVCDEAWRDAIIGLAKIDGTGNFIKGTDAISAGTDNHIVRWNGTTGLQDSAITIADTTAIMNFLPTTGLLDIQCDSIRNIFMCTNSLNGSIRIGRDALSTVAYASDTLRNVGIGNSALKSITSGGYNVGIGTSSLYTNATGIENVAVGYTAGYLSTGSDNNYFGVSSGVNITSGTGNTCIGVLTGGTASGALNYSIGLGYGAKVATDYYCQIGADGEATHSSKMKFRSQVVCDEAWRDGNTYLVSNDGTGNFVKTAVAVPSSGGATIAFTGAIVSTNVDITYSIVNGICTLDIPAFEGNGNSSATTINGSAIPVSARPSVERVSTCLYVKDQGVGTQGYMIVRSTGVLTLYRFQVSSSNIVYSNFSSGATANGYGLIHGSTITYRL
jgi:hypothetical protein